MSLLRMISGALLLGLVACSTAGKGDGDLTVTYEEFQKILSPTSIVLLEGEDALLTTVALPGDEYPKVYRYDNKTKKFTMEYDHGSAVTSLTEDRAGKNIYLMIDDNGDENYKTYTYDKTTKKPTLLFGIKGRKSTPVNTDKDGKFLYMISNHENKAIYSVYRMDLTTKAMTRVTDGKTNFMGAVLSPDATKLAAVRYLSNNENQVYIIDTATKKPTLLFKKRNSVFHPAFFDKTTNNLYGTSDYKRDRTGCARIPTNKLNYVVYVKEAKNKDTSCAYGEWSDLYFVTETYNGKKELKMYRKMFKDPVPVPELFNNQSVAAVGFDRKAKTLTLLFSAANNPGSLYNITPADKAPSATKVLDYNRSSIPLQDLATSYDYEYKSFDGMKIHGILYAKKDWKTSGKKYPLVVWPHGGPDSNEGHRYRHWFQYLALNGFVVFAPNYRGSTGYGKKFETLNDKDWGGGHIKDVVAGKEAVAKEPWIDESNAFIFGGSFGGYSTLAAVTFHPEAFKAAVGFVALGNLETFMKSIPPDEAWQTEFKREVGDPVKDKALYKERSPFFHVNKVKTPLQIYQAENDVRTVKAEMDSYVAELKKNGKPVEYTVLKDVGHRLARPESRKQVLEGTVKFFKSHTRLQ